MTKCSAIISELDQKCSRYFTYRDLIEVGETQLRTGISNLPKQRETWDGIRTLSEKILDPLVDRFGPITLTYGFSSRELIREIRKRKKPQIAPELDQHAGAEINQLGNRICPRQGQACDVLIPGVSSTLAALWIVENLPFDRLYLYGELRPLHVSAGPQNSRYVAWLRETREGQKVPRRVSRDWLSEQLRIANSNNK